MLFVRRW